MPRVKLNTPSDDLNAIKKRINKKNKAKYAGVEADMPAVRAETQNIYNSAFSKLNDIVASVGEINAQLVLTAGKQSTTPWASKAIDRYITATSKVKTQTADLNAFLEQHVAELSNFSEAQLSAISKLNQELTATFTEIASNINKLSGKKQVAIKRVFGVFVEDLMKLNQVLQGTLGVRDGSLPTKIAALDAAVGSDPNQEEEPPATTRKTRADKGQARGKRDSAGGDPATLVMATPTPPARRRGKKKLIVESDGTEADTEEGNGYSTGAGFLGLDWGRRNEWHKKGGGHEAWGEFQPVRHFPVRMVGGEYTPTRFL